MESILTSIKKALGIEKSYTHFDPDIIMNINAVLMTLNQLGVGPVDGFLIEGSDETWEDFLGDAINLEAVKLYMYFKVRLGFDPPANAFVVEAMQRQIDEFEWRINLQAEPPAPIIIVEEEVY